ncbi:pectin methyl esterase [Mycena olivaceomarginata]|nr:pectin methyl esterase [Mycena olivaceomarginata]
MLLTVLLCLLSIPAALGVSRTTPPAGAIVVRQTGATAGQFTTISAAMASLSGTAPATVFIFPGTYTEQVVIAHPNLTIMGSTTDTGSYKQNTVTITNNLNAQDAGSDDMSATVRATKPASNLRIYNVNIANTYGVGRQAVALSAKGTRQGFYGLSITGYQDTLYADVTGVQYYSNCYIQGACRLYFRRRVCMVRGMHPCVQRGRRHHRNSRDSTTDTSYYVIDSSTITSAPGVSSLVGKVYLGRPWRMYARVVFQKLGFAQPHQSYRIHDPGRRCDAVSYACWWYYTTLLSTQLTGSQDIQRDRPTPARGLAPSQRVTYTPISAPITHAQVLGADYATWIDGSF